MKNQHTTNFDELQKKWSSSDSLYQCNILLNNTSPNDIFEIAFSDQAKDFFHELIKNPSNQTQPTCNLTPWKDKKHDHQNKNGNSIKQRTLKIEATESGFTFFLRKQITTNITQTAFFNNNDDSLILFSVAQSRTESKIADHMMIDKWVIKWEDIKNKKQQNQNKRVSISVHAKIIWKNFISPTATIVKSKWLRFYQSRFETWRNLIKKFIVKYNAKMKQIKTMKPYIGTWNKLNSYHNIRITVEKIQYSDGSKFNVSVDENKNEIIADYVSTTFKGKLIKKKDNFDEIKWDNGSIWVRNGFKKFDGEYKQNSTEQRYIVSKNGTITLPITGKNIRFLLKTSNSISYTLSKRHSKSTATLSADGKQLEWDNGTVWTRVADSKRAKPQSSKENVSKSRNNKKKPKLPSTPPPAKPTKPTQNIGEKVRNEEMENDRKSEEIVHDERDNDNDTDNVKSNDVVKDSDIGDGFEDEFDFYEDIECKEEAPKLSIKTNDHFIVINDDELFDLREADNEMKTDEWLLV